MIGADEEGCQFRFGCRGHGKFDDLGKSEEWVIVGWDGNVFRDKYVGLCPAAGLGFIKEGRVVVPCEYHASGAVGDAIIWVCDDVVE